MSIVAVGVMRFRFNDRSQLCSTPFYDRGFMPTRMNMPMSILHVLDQKAIQRGYISFEHALKRQATETPNVLYLVVKKYNLEEIMQCLRAIFVARSPHMEKWYTASWTKTLILAGNPERLQKHIPFDHITLNTAILGPLPQNHRHAKHLLHLTVPLQCEPQNLTRFAYKSTAFGVRIRCKDIQLSMPKFVVQLVHITMEMAIEHNHFSPITNIELYAHLGLSDTNIDYIRIDGGLTEVNPYTHIANAYRGMS